MHGLMTLVLILSPMFVGFALPTHRRWVLMSEKLLTQVVFVLLVVIGIELGLVEDLGEKIGEIALYLFSLMALTISFGVVSLLIFDKLIPCPHARQGNQNSSQPSVSLRGSLVQLGCLAAGFILAKLLPPTLLPPEKTTTVLLMLLLFLVGISLKGSGISLKQAMLNKRGLQISLVFMAATLLAGVVFAIGFGVPVSQGLALAAGFGWYSLSGTIMTDAYGAVWGSVALMNDLGREVLALIFIPVLMRYSSSAGIGLGGVTSLDFTLPTILQSAGTQIMPLVISFGFITNVVSPVLMVIFSTMA